MILVRAGNFLSEFPNLDSLLSPQDSACPLELSVGSLTKGLLPPLTNSCLSPIKPTNLELDINLSMDASVSFSPAKQSQASRHYCASSPARMPLSPMHVLNANQRNTESAIANFTVKIDY
jgi:hypothetical protein